MRKSANRRPYQPRRLKLATMPWKVDMVFGPIERILHRIEADCTIDSAQGRPVFHEDGKGGWYDVVENLRDIMFDCLQQLKNKDNPMEIDRAIAMTKVADVIIDSAKVEVDHMRIAGGQGSGFIPVQSVDRNRPQLPGETYSERTGNGSKTVTTLPGGATVTRHKMGG